jgi:AMP deaminase
VLIDYAPSSPSAELRDICTHVRQCLELRAKLVWTPLRSEKQYDIFQTPPYIAPSVQSDLAGKRSDISFGFTDGVFSSWVGGAEDGSASVAVDAASSTAPAHLRFEAPNRAEFGVAMGVVMDFVGSGPAKTFCHNRLHILEARFNLHELLNHDIEQLVQKSVPHRDFYNVRKIDNHVHRQWARSKQCQGIASPVPLSLLVRSSSLVRSLFVSVPCSVQIPPR